MTAYQVPAAKLADGLIPGVESDRAYALNLLNMAYAKLGENPEANFGLWRAIRDSVFTTLRRRYEALGFTAARFVLDAFWARVDKPMPSKDSHAHVALIQALMTDYTQPLMEHLLYRLQNDGNVHLDFQGPTGMAKSSCAISVADWLSPIQPQELVDHLSFDISELRFKLKGKKPGQTVIMDEYVAMAGEGARTFQSLFTNLEDTLRASQVNLFRCSPRAHDEGTMQAVLELILWDPKRKCSLFLVWLEGVPHGVVAIPWCRSDLYAAYRPWKAANVERSRAGHFRDPAYIPKAVVACFEDADFVEFLRKSTNKPQKKDFKFAFETFHPTMLSNAQADNIVGFMHSLCYGYDRLAGLMERKWGVKPNPGLEAVAIKCYKD